MCEQIPHRRGICFLGFHLSAALFEGFPDVIRDTAIVGRNGDGVGLGVGGDLGLVVAMNC